MYQNSLRLIDPFDMSLSQRVVKIYDVLETDPSKKLIKECYSVGEAERFTGVTNIGDKIRNKYRIQPHRNKLNKLICFR